MTDNGAQRETAAPGGRVPLLVVEPVLLRAADAARLCGFADRTWRKFASAGLVPAGVQLGRSRRWRLDELRAWVAAGCPGRDRWDEMKKPAETLPSSAGER